jgi:hypothetical protein
MNMESKGLEEIRIKKTTWRKWGPSLGERQWGTMLYAALASAGLLLLAGDAAGFSFDVYGDSRSMMYLPSKADQEAEARKLMVDMFDLVLPEKVADAVVQKHVKLIYDPSTHELIQVVMPFETKSEVSTLTLDKGWVTSASVEDVKLLPGVRRTMFRKEGGEWVARNGAAGRCQQNCNFTQHPCNLL